MCYTGREVCLCFHGKRKAVGSFQVKNQIWQRETSWRLWQQRRKRETNQQNRWCICGDVYWIQISHNLLLHIILYEGMYTVILQFDYVIKLTWTKTVVLYWSSLTNHVNVFTELYVAFKFCILQDERRERQPWQDSHSRLLRILGPSIPFPILILPEVHWSCFF